MDPFTNKPVADSEKIKLWDSLRNTDPKFTKQFDRGGFKGTAINGTYVAMRLTQAFGPCGLGWKFVIDEERVIPGPLTKSTSMRKEVVGQNEFGSITVDVTDVTEKQEMLHVIRGHIEYLDASGVQRSTGPQFGQTKLVQIVKAGTPQERSFFDEEAPKKSVTDCLSKCAVLLGVASDVHMGAFDDNKYVNQMKVKFAEKLTAEVVAKLATAMKDAGLKESTFLKRYSIGDIGDLPVDLFDGAMADIKAYAEKKAQKAGGGSEVPPPAGDKT